MNLIFNCTSEDDFINFQRIINQSKFTADSVNKEFQSISFHCEEQRDADKLETEIQFLADIHEICGYFETES